MDHLVHVEEKEITINFELGRKCKTALRIRSLMHTMPVAFKLQTTSPYKFSVRPSNGYVRPLAEFTLDIILKPQQELPPTFPFSDEKFVLKTALAPFSNDNSALPERVCNEWFSSPTTHVYIDAKLKVVYIGAHLLRQCVACEDVFAVEQMLMRQTGVSVAAKDGRTALHVAASVGSSKLVDMLLQCGAEIDAMDAVGRTPLWEAISGGHVGVVKELLARGAHTDIREPFRNNSTAAIHVAATLASPKVLEVLIENGASLETKDQQGRTALHFAVEAERMESLKVLICAGADTNAQRADGRAPLLIAAENGSLEMVHLLVEGGANTNIKAENGQAASEVVSEKGHVVIVEALKAGEELLQAARRGDAKAVATLLQHGGRNTAWAQDSAGWTALHVAAFKGHVHIVRRLLLADGGTKALQEQDKEGHTPLHCAAEGGNREVVELLLAMGANPLAASSRGATPAELASALGFTTIARLLQQRACHPGIDCPSQAQLELDAKGQERMCSSITKSCRLHRQSISPGPDLSSLRMRSATPSPNHKEALTASSIRFSTPRRLPQSKQQLHHDETCSNPSSLRTHADVVLQYTKLGSLVNKKNLAPSQPQASSTSDMCKSSDVKSTRHPDAQKVSKNALQGPFLPQSNHIQQKSEKEECNAATSMPQHMPVKKPTGLQDSHKHHLKQTLAALLDRVHGSKMEVDSSATSDMRLQERAFGQNPVKDRNQHCPRQDAASLYQRNKRTTKEAITTTSNKLLQDRAFVHNQVEDGRNVNNSNHNSVVRRNGQNPVKDRNQHCPRQDAASLYQQRNKRTTKEAITTTSNKLLQDRAFVHNQVEDGRNVNNSNHNSVVRRNAASQCQQRSKSTTKKVATPTSGKDRAPVQNITHERVVHGYQHPVAASSRSKKTQQTCKEAQRKSNLRQQLTNGADVKGCPQDPQKLNASLSANEDHAHRNRATVGPTVDNPVSAAQAHFRHEGIRGPAFNKQNNIDDNITVEATSCPASGRSLVSQSDLAHIPTTPNPADSMLLSRSHTEQACPSISTSSSVQISPDKLLQSKHNNHVHASPDAPQRCATPLKQEMMREIDTSIMPPQSTSQTDRMLQLEETKSFKPTCKAAWNDQNRPVYTPPLRIKQMRKPMSTPILRNSGSPPRQIRTEEVATKATGTTSEEKPAKARSVTFRELFSQGTF